MARNEVLFRLGKSPRDRRIAAWLEIQRDNGENVSDHIKRAIELYMDRVDGDDPIRDLGDKLEALRRLIESGVIVRGVGEPETDQDQQVLDNILGMNT